MATPDLVDILDSLSLATRMVECAFFACENDDRGSAMGAVLDEARKRLNVAFDQLEDLRGGRADRAD